MKKILLLTFIMVLFNTVYAGEFSNIIKPVWKDVCPEGLEKSEYKEIPWYWPYSMKKTQAEINYWADKRLEFEARISDCDTSIDKYRINCYTEVKQKYLTEFEERRLDSNRKKVTEIPWRDFNYRGIKPVMIELNHN